MIRNNSILRAMRGALLTVSASLLAAQAAVAPNALADRRSEVQPVVLADFTWGVIAGDDTESPVQPIVVADTVWGVTAGDDAESNSPSRLERSA